MMTRNLNILDEINILYLEDDDSLLKHTADALDDFVKNVFAVKTSQEAMRILENKRIDVIISDILLENETGIDFLKELQEDKNIHIPTVLTTAHTDTKYLLDAIKLKVENYIVKPINLKELLIRFMIYFCLLFKKERFKKTQISSEQYQQLQIINKLKL